MKLLFFTDTHIRGVAPKSRTDDFLQTLKDKFNEVKDIVNNEEIDYVLHGGDWFDRPDISSSIVREFAIILKQFNAPIYTISGNHDIYGYNPNTLSRTMLGLLEGTGMMKILKFGEIVILEKERLKVELCGSPFDYEIDNEGLKKHYIVKKQDGVDYCINMVHGMLLLKPFMANIKYTLLDSIIDTEADITLSGHYHAGFGIKQINGKYFANPGSLARVDASMKELERMPKILIIELAKNKIDVKERTLSVAKPGEQVLSRKYIEEAHLRRNRVHDFMQQIEVGDNFDYDRIDLNEIINRISNAEGINEKVKLESIKRLEIARSNLGK